MMLKQTRPTSRRAVLAGAAAAPVIAAGPAMQAHAGGTVGPDGHGHGHGQGRAYPVSQPRPGRYPQDPKTPKRDFRAFWLSVVANIDWPSAPVLSAQEQKDELIAWLDLAVQQRHNAVILQVRPTADTLWRSDREPWSAWLTGTQGKDPGYDPLAFAVAEAHKRNLALHAWFNPYRVAMTEDPQTLIPSHPARRNPDWVLPYGGKLYYNPGLPKVRRFVVDTIMEAVRRYDIDGVHFDDYFYPYPVEGETFADEDAFAEYGDGQSLEDWRRGNITALIDELGRAIKRSKPHVQFGISPFAIWRNKATDPQGSDTTAGAQTYDDLYADTRAWVRDEQIDYVVPQVYWSIGFAAADYAKVTDWWARTVAGTKVHLFIGQATYKVDDNADPNWSQVGELSSHLEFNTKYPQVQGNIYFSAKSVRTDALGATSLLNRTWYSRPALLPVVAGRAWAPRPVQGLRRSGAALRWSPGSRGSARYAIYRVPVAGRGKRVSSADLADAGNLVAVLPAGGRSQSWTDPSPSTEQVAYVVSALDRLGHESTAVAVHQG
ncbi:glycoside hydrolase family 10 protein [Dermacoccaceae bacterium W4C1]